MLDRRSRVELLDQFKRKELTHEFNATEMKAVLQYSLIISDNLEGPRSFSDSMLQRSPTLTFPFPLLSRAFFHNDDFIQSPPLVGWLRLHLCPPEAASRQSPCPRSTKCWQKRKSYAILIIKDKVSLSIIVFKVSSGHLITSLPEHPPPMIRHNCNYVERLSVYR